MSTAELIERIRPLPPAEKCKLLERMWEEFGDELSEADDALTPEQVAELERRAEDALRHPGRGTPIAQVSAEIRQRLLSRK